MVCIVEINRNDYKISVLNVNRGEKQYTIENLCPIMDEQAFKNKQEETEESLFDIFIKYENVKLK